MTTPFTDNMQEFSQFVSRIEASGGSDVPEDLCGGLEAASKLNWTAQSRHLFLLTDAPCHVRFFWLNPALEWQVCLARSSAL